MCSHKRSKKLAKEILTHLGEPFEENEITQKELAEQERIKGLFSDELRDRLWLKSQARAEERLQKQQDKRPQKKRPPRLPREIVRAIVMPSSSPIPITEPSWLQEQAMAFSYQPTSSEVILRKGGTNDVLDSLLDEERPLSSLCFELLIQLPNSKSIEIEQVSPRLWESSSFFNQGTNYGLYLQHTLEDGHLAVLRYNGLHLSELHSPSPCHETKRVQVHITAPETSTEGSEFLCILWCQESQYLSQWLPLVANRDLSSEVMKLFLQFLHNQEVDLTFFRFVWEL